MSADAASTSESKLASAVILCAVRDFKSFPDLETSSFLLGKTHISRFWFSVAGLNPLSRVELARLRQEAF